MTPHPVTDAAAAGGVRDPADGEAAGGASSAQWAEVLATALVGTARRGSTAPAADPAHTPAGAPATDPAHTPVGAPATDPAAELLDRAAAWAAYRRAGVQPGQRAEPPVPAPPEDRPVVGDRAARRLAWLLDPQSRRFDAASRVALTGQWLALAVERGRLVRPAQLPDLLEYGRSHREQRAAITVAGGARIRWLAEQNPEWTYLAVVADESAVDSEQWSTGTRAQRVGYLRTLRRHEPGRARELLEADWATLTPDERGELVAALESGLGPADEPLLERALDDRRKDVRETAAALLAVVAGSAYGARMAQRARTALTPGPGGVIVVDPPAECDRSMRRDGINPKPPAGTGARAWWLEEVLARTPLSTWPAAADLLARPIADEWAPTVHRGLARAAAVERDPVWAAALVPVLDDPLRGTTSPGEAARDRECAAGLYPLLDNAELTAHATAALAAGSAARWGLLLGSVPGPWPDGLARAALAGIAALAAQPKLAGDLYQLCRLAAIRLPADLAPATHELVEQLHTTEPNNPRLSAVAALADLLSFRHEMNLEMVT